MSNIDKIVITTLNVVVIILALSVLLGTCIIL